MSEPTPYSPEIVREILELHADGFTISDILADPRYPSRSTFYSWLNKNPEHAEQYARAREAKGDYDADRIEKISLAITPENANAKKVEADIVKWLAERRNRKNWGNKQAVEHSGEINGKITEIRTVIVDPKHGDTGDTDS